MNNYFSVLSTCPLFSSITSDELSTVLHCIGGYTQHLAEGETIIFSGHPVRCMGVVLEGTLTIYKENYAGVPQILDFVQPAQLFAESIVWTRDQMSSVTVSAKNPSTVLLIPYQKIIAPCSNGCSFHHTLIRNMLFLIAEKNKQLNLKIELLALKGMHQKLASYLLAESKKQNSLTFQIVPNRNELAEYLNVSRPSMSRELSHMKKLGIIDFYKNSFKILI